MIDGNYRRPGPRQVLTSVHASTTKPAHTESTIGTQLHAQTEGFGDVLAARKTRIDGGHSWSHRLDHLLVHGPAKNSVEAVQKHAHADVTARQLGRLK